MRFSFELNTKELQVGIERTIVRIRRERKAIIKEEAEAILAESLAEVPRDTGALANSADIMEIEDGDYAVYYGAPGYINPKNGTPVDAYMVKVHEDLSASHPNGGKAKFLEDPVRRHEQKFESRLARKLRSLFGGK